MTDREILIEILAIKQYEHDFSGEKWPPRSCTPWRFLAEEDRENYRQMIRDAGSPLALYESES